MRLQVARVRTPGRSALVLAVLLAGGASMTALGSATTSGGGWDVSWPQCTSSGNVEALPGSPQIGVVGVNDGRPFTTNPCLQSELEWAGAGAEVYINTDNPGPVTSVVKGKVVQKPTNWPTVGQKPKPISGQPAQTITCALTGPNGTTATSSCAYVYGWNAADAAYTTVTSALARIPAGPLKPSPSLEWWLDVESANAWMSST